MNWQEVVEHPSLRDLPFKIELDENGKIIISAVRIVHSLLQSEIASILRTLRQDGFALTECAIRTPRGTKVADVAWASHNVLLTIKSEFDASIAPEVCVEIWSASNTKQEMVEKRELYFERGAHEFWLCTENGEISFFNRSGVLTGSHLFPDFPSKITV